MKKHISKIVFIIIFLVGILLIMQTKSNASVSMSISPSSKEVAPNGSFKVTITVSGGAGYVNISASNGTVSSKKEWIDNSSITLNCVATGSANKVMTINASGVIGDYTTEKDVNKSASASVNIKVPVQTPTQTPKPTTTNKTTKTTTTKKQTTKKEETKKEPIEEVKEEEDASSEWGISSLKLVGVKENGEEVDLSLDKEFNINTYEYSCNVGNDIKTIKVFKEAYEYNDLVQISGLDEELKAGENEIVLKMAKEGKDTLSYKIKVIKEEPQEDVQEASSNVEEKSSNVEEKEKPMVVSIPVFWFVILEIAIVAVSVGTTVVVMKYLRKK